MIARNVMLVLLALLMMTIATVAACSKAEREPCSKAEGRA